MAQSPMTGVPTLTYFDRPDVPETYADSLEKMFFDGVCFRLEFVVNRIDTPKPPAAPTGKKVTAARLVLPVPAMLAIAQQINGMLATMQAQGIVKTHPVPKPTGSVN